jgi:hypothetical protein
MATYPAIWNRFLVDTNSALEGSNSTHLVNCGIATSKTSDWPIAIREILIPFLCFLFAFGCEFQSSMKASMRLCVKFCDANQVGVHAVLLTHTNAPFHSPTTPPNKRKTPNQQLQRLS